MTIQYQVIETKYLHVFWILLGNSTGLLNRDCLSIWQRFKKFPTKYRWLRWSLKIALLKTLICWNIYYYRPNCKERVFALDSSLPLHLKGNAKITFVNTKVKKLPLWVQEDLSTHLWTYWSFLHSGASIII